MKLNVDGHEIHAMSRVDAKFYRGDAPYVVISICDTDKEPVKFVSDPNRKAVLQLRFRDFIAPRDAVGSYHQTQFPYDTAKKVWDFVEAHWPNVKAVVCHCEMGVSRSAAVAAAITKAKGGKDECWFVHLSPNKPVYYQMLEVVHDERQKSLHGRGISGGDRDHYASGVNPDPSTQRSGEDSQRPD
jgi:hypothetical protein